MSRKILIPAIIFLTLLVILTMLSLLQRNTARQQLALAEVTHATTVAEIQSTMAAKIQNQTTIQAELQSTMVAKIQNQATAQAEIEMVQATAIKEIEVQATEQAETDAYVHEVEESYQATLAQKLGTQAQLRLNDTVDPTLGMLLATESLRRFHSVEGDVAIRRGIELMSWHQVFTSFDQGGCVRDISLSADGQRLATSSSRCRYDAKDVEIKVWDVPTNQEIVHLGPSYEEFSVREINLSADGDWLVISQRMRSNGSLMTKVINVETTQEITQTVSLGTAFNPDSKQLALINDDDTVVIWDIETQEILSNLVHDKKVTSANFSPDGKWLITYGEDKVWLWDNNTNKLIREIPFKDSRVYFSPDSRLLAIVDRSSAMVRIWEVDTWQEIAQAGYGLSIIKAEFSPDGDWLATLDNRGNIQIWATSTGIEITRISFGSSGAATMTFSPDGKWLVTSAIGDKIQVWETGTWRESARIPKQGYIVEFSADGKLLASNSDNYDSAKVWKLEAGPEIARFYGASKYSSLVFSSDGQYLAAQKTKGDKTSTQIWHIMTQEAVEPSELSETQLASFSFSAVHQPKIAQMEAGTLVISDTVTNQEISRMVCDEEIVADILAFNEQAITRVNRGLLAIGGADASYKNLVRVWDIATCQEKYQLPVTFRLSQVAFSPNGQLLAVGTNQIWADWKGVGEIRIWDVTTGQELVFINSGQVRSIFFSADNHWLVVNGNRILETTTGHEVTYIFNPPAGQATFGPDNRWLATGSLINYEYISVWAWQPADLIALACARVQRNLTKEEWKQFLGNEPYLATCPHLLD